jgi:outer membrane lipoprotein-sorting protein
LSAKTLLCLLLAVVLLAGCSVSEKNLPERIKQRTDRLAGYYAELEAEVASFTGEQVYRVRQWQDFSGRFRVEVKAEEEEQHFICDGSQVWICQPEIGDCFRLAAEESHELVPPFLLVGYLNGLQQAAEFEFLGKRELNGQERYVAAYAGPLEGEEVRLWLDGKTMFPVLVEIFLEGEMLSRLEVKRLELNPPLPAELFEYTAKTEQEAGAYCLVEPLSLAEAKKGWPVDVYLPSYLPEGFSLYVISRVSEPDREQLIFVYRGPEPFTLVQYPKREDAVLQSAAVREVYFGLRQGYFQQNLSNNLAVLRWSLEESSFILAGALPLEQMVKIAGSLKPDN